MIFLLSSLKLPGLLANIASGTSDHTKVVVDHNAVPIFIGLLGSPTDDIREQAVLALGNMAGDSPQYRDLVLEKGALTPLLTQLWNERATLSMLRIVTLTLLNLCRGEPRPSLSLVYPTLPALQVLVHSGDRDVLSYACWALSFLFDGSGDGIKYAIEDGVYPRLVELLVHPSLCVQIPALRTVRNIARGEDYQRQCIINHGTLLCLRSLLRHNNKTIQKDACWAISGITDGNKKHNQAVIEAGLIEPLIYLLRTSETDIKRAAAFAVSKVISGGTRHELRVVGLKGFIRPLCDLLVFTDPVILTACLEGLETLSKAIDEENGYNSFVKLIDDARGLDKIKDLLSHKHPKVRKKAEEMWEPLYSKALGVWKFFEELADLVMFV